MMRFPFPFPPVEPTGNRTFITADPPGTLALNATIVPNGPFPSVLTKYMQGKIVVWNSAEKDWSDVKDEILREPNFTAGVFLASGFIDENFVIDSAIDLSRVSFFATTRATLVIDHADITDGFNIVLSVGNQVSVFMNGPCAPPGCTLTLTGGAGWINFGSDVNFPDVAGSPGIITLGDQTSIYTSDNVTPLITLASGATVQVIGYGGGVLVSNASFGGTGTIHYSCDSVSRQELGFDAVPSGLSVEYDSRGVAVPFAVSTVSALPLSPVPQDGALAVVLTGTSPAPAIAIAQGGVWKINGTQVRP